MISFRSCGILSRLMLLGCLCKLKVIGEDNNKIFDVLPAKTGRDNNNKTAVITTAQPNSANFAPQNNKHLSNKT